VPIHSGPPPSHIGLLTPSATCASGLSDLTVRVAELAALPVKAKRALFIENDVTFLSAPAPRD
jgi:hypothetical protein